MNNLFNKDKSLPKSIYAVLFGIWVVILIMFSLHGYYPTHQIEVQPAERLSYDLATKVNDPELIFVEITKDRTVMLNGEGIDPSKLADQIKTRFINRSRDRQIVHIKAPKEISYGFFFSIVDLVKSTDAYSIQPQIDYLDEQVN